MLNAYVKRLASINKVQAVLVTATVYLEVKMKNISIIIQWFK